MIVTLALGRGANLTIFSLMRAVLWRPLPYREPERIVVIQVEARNVRNAGATRAELLGLQERSQSFEQVATIEGGDANLEYAGEMEHVLAASVSDNFLPLMGVRPALGRMLDSRADDSQQGARAILISDELWRRRFGADAGIIGRGLRVDDADMQIAGVMPAGFRLFLPTSVNGSEQIDVWFPYRIDPTIPYRGLPMLARLRPGVTLDRANAELQTLAAQFEREHPEFYSGAKGWMASPSDRGLAGEKVRFTARALHETMTSDVRPALFLLAGAVGFVLLIACVNAANLMLARGSARQRELEIRRALGAGRMRIVRQLLSESLVLALAAAVAGLFCARLGLEAMGRIGASHIPMQSRVAMDAPVALLAVTLAAVTSVLFGLLPAWRLASGKPGQLRGGRTGTPGAGARRLQRTLVAAEVALSIVPLAGAGLMLRSFVNLLHSPLGFEPAGVVTAKLPLDFQRYPRAEQRCALMRDVLDRVRALPGVRSASAAAPLPLAGQERRRVGRADQAETPPMLATQQMALPGYLAVMRTPLVDGRDFTDDEIAAHRNVTIIDEGLAKRLWPEGAIGKVLSVYRTGWRNDLEVVGVTAAVRVTRVRDDSIPHFMMPYDGSYSREMSLVVKTSEATERMAPRIQAAVNAAHGGRAAYDIRPMSAYIADSIGDTRFVLFVLAVFAGASVLLAAVGLYGTLAYLTAQRTREFGIRLALGCSVRALVAIVIRESILLAVTGAVVGMLGVAGATRAMRELLYGVRPLDGATLGAVAALVGIVALGAAGVPAWRATRIDPQASLRSE